MTPKPTPKPTPATSPALAPASTEELDRLVHGEHGDPHTVLGPHPYDGGLTVRVYKPLATRVSIRWGDDEEAELAHEHEGVWAGVLPLTDVPDYRVSVAYGRRAPPRAARGGPR